MSETIDQTLSDVSDTYLAPLYWKAMESQRPDALIKDEKVVELVTQMRLDFSRVRQIKMNELLNTMRIMVTREMDCYAREFLSRHPDGVVVHIGCGLDSRFERIAERDSRVEWYDLDLPEVIDLRCKYIGEEEERYHLLACSVLDNAWLEVVRAHQSPPGTQISQHPFLFLAEGVFMYFEEAQVKSLVLTLCDRFPGAELVFDAYSPIHVWRSNLQTAKFGLRVHWGIWHGQELESWGAASSAGAGICLLDEWGFFDHPEPRLAYIRWLRPIESLFRTMRIYHFQLGEIAG